MSGTFQEERDRMVDWLVAASLNSVGKFDDAHERAKWESLDDEQKYGLALSLAQFGWVISVSSRGGDETQAALDIEQFRREVS